MMSGLLQQASKLPGGGNLSSRHTKPSRPSRVRAATPMPSSFGSPEDSDSCPASSTPGSYTSGALQTGHSLPSLSDAERPIGGIIMLGVVSDEPKTPEASGSSQEQVTLASLRKEALGEFSHPKGGSKSTRTVGVGDPPPNCQMKSRPDKIFKEAYFRKIEWSRVFVSGPMNRFGESPLLLQSNLSTKRFNISEGGC